MVSNFEVFAVFDVFGIAIDREYDKFDKKMKIENTSTAN